MSTPTSKVEAASEAEAKPTATQNPNELDETRWEKIAANLKTIGGAVLLALVIRTCLFEAFEIEGPSMEPTLFNGDRVVVAKFSYGLFLPLRDEAEITWGSPNPGDVVIIKSPADGVDIVKRVIGVGGDRIEMRGDNVLRNGQALPLTFVSPCETGQGSRDEDCRIYESKVGDQVFRLSSARALPDPIPTEVPEGHIYVLGDHRDHSNDSRNPMVSAIPIRRVKGHALSIYWSSDEDGTRWSRIFKAVQ